MSIVRVTGRVDTNADVHVAVGCGSQQWGVARNDLGRPWLESFPSPLRKTTRYRLNRGGDRESQLALSRIVVTPMSSHEQTRAYATLRRAEGLNTAEIMGCTRRSVARA